MYVPSSLFKEHFRTCTGKKSFSNISSSGSSVVEHPLELQLLVLRSASSNSQFLKLAVMFGLVRAIYSKRF